MREAIGGTYLFWGFLFVIFVYVAFIAVIMNYASAYRTNNYIVSEVENLEGNVTWRSVKNTVRNAYNYADNVGFCCSKNASGGVVYKVETYIDFEIPLLTVKFRIPITNESKTIYNGTCNYSDYCSGGLRYK